MYAIHQVCFEATLCDQWLLVLIVGFTTYHLTSTLRPPLSIWRSPPNPLTHRVTPNLNPLGSLFGQPTLPLPPSATLLNAFFIACTQKSFTD